MTETPTNTQDALPAAAAVLDIDDATVPVRSNAVSIREEAEEDGKYLLYVDGKESLYLVNGTAKTVLGLCDGTRAVGEIVQEIAGRFVIPDGVDAAAAVRRYLTTLVKARIVTMG